MENFHRAGAPFTAALSALALVGCSSGYNETDDYGGPDRYSDYNESDGYGDYSSWSGDTSYQVAERQSGYASAL